MAKRNAKGEGSFKANPDRTITHRKCVGYKEDGNRKTLTVTRENKSACIRAMKQKEREWKESQENKSTSLDMTVTELCNSHLAYQIDHDELKPKSIDRRECTIDNHISRYEIGHMNVGKVQVKDVDDFVNTLIKEERLSVSSIEKVVDVLNAAYKWVVIRKELLENPVEPIKPQLVKKMQKLKQKTANDADVIVLSEEEKEAFVREALIKVNRTGKYKYDAGLYGVLLLYTGMRCGEMLALHWKDLDLENNLLTIEKSRTVAKNRSEKEEKKKYIHVVGTTKNEKARTIELHSEAMNVLKLIKERENPELEDLIVKTKTGRANTATNLEHRMHTIFKNAGLDDSISGLHIFRRTFATNMYANGARIEEIAAYIGDLVSTTERYYVAIRKKLKGENGVKQIVSLPEKRKVVDG